MVVNLRLENASEDFLKAIKIMAKALNVSVRVKKERTLNGYTKEFEASLLKDLKELEKERKKGTLKSFDSVKEMRKALENFKDERTLKQIKTAMQRDITRIKKGDMSEISALGEGIALSNR